jgi:hypothetical protein
MQLYNTQREMSGVLSPHVKTTFALKCSNLLLVMEDPPATAAAASRNLAGSELEAGPTSRMFLRLFSGLSSGSEAA